MLNWKRLALTVPRGLLLVGGAVRADTVPSGMYGDYTRERDQTVSLGYRELFAPDVHNVDEGESEGLDLSGGTYRFKAICDDDCDDIDLEVLDSNGRVVGSDYLMDSLPIVTVTLPRGEYRVRLRMESCSWEPCGTVLMYFKRR